jgi:hypothetical protein
VSILEWLRPRGNITVEVFLKEEEGRSILINSFESIRDCAKFFKVDPRTIIRRLDSGEVHNYENNTYLLKRKKGWLRPGMAGYLRIPGRAAAEYLFLAMAKPPRNFK